MPTFYAKTGDKIFDSKIKSFFESRGYTSSNFPVNIVFLSGEPSYYRNHKDLKNSEYVNVIQKRPDITYKHLLAEKFEGSDFIIKTEPYEEDMHLPKKFVKIVKLEGSFAGKGMTVVTTREDMISWINNWDPKADWFIQDYILNPALKDGYKFHLRVHVIVFSKPYSVYLCKQIRYYLAKKKYVNDNWSDPDIHITHYTEGKEYLFPEDKPDGWVNASLTGIQKITETVFEGVKIKADWNGKNSYYIFGMDVMFNRRKPILLEVNDRVGLGDKALDVLIPGIVDILEDKKVDSFVKL
jgi:hypothetical protein